MKQIGVTDVIVQYLCQLSVALRLLGGVFPVYAVVMLVGSALGVAVFVTSSSYTPPVYHAVSVQQDDDPDNRVGRFLGYRGKLCLCLMHFTLMLDIFFGMHKDYSFQEDFIVLLN